MANRGYDVVVDVDTEVQDPQSINQQRERLPINLNPQGDLGHTDLQEDLEFHSSSMSLHKLHNTSPDPHYSSTPFTTSSLSHTAKIPPLANRLPASRLRRQSLQQNPAGHKQPVRADLFLPELQTLPLVPPLLRPVLRRRHVRGPTPLPRRPLPALQLPRHPRRQPGSLRALLDCHHCRLHPLSLGNHISVSGREEERG